MTIRHNRKALVLFGFLDERGCWYLAGETGSTDRPTVNAFQAVFSDNGDAMVANLVPADQDD